MLHRLILSFALAILFALGQQGAIVHEISHYAELAPESQQQDKAPHSPLCEKCVSYGKLASALDITHALPPVVATGIDYSTFESASQPALTELPYSARAPPLLS